MRTSKHSARLSVSMNKVNDFKPDTRESGFSLTGTNLQRSSSIPDKNDTDFVGGILPSKASNRLPKLYTTGLYNNYSNKLLSAKQKFSILNQQLQKGTEAPQEVPLRALVKQTEEVLSKTYSIKYFGINNDQIGILSQRVPIKSPAKAKFVVSSSRRTENNASMDKLNSPQHTSAMNGVTLDLYNNHKLATDPSAGKRASSQPKLKGAGGEHNQPGIKWQNESDYHEQNDFQEDNGYPNGVSPIDAPFGQKESKAHPEEYDVYVVNNYFIPKQLHSVRNKQKRSINVEQLEEVIDQQLKAQSKKTPTQEKIPANYDRLARGVSKVKRTMLRAVIPAHKSEGMPSQEMIIESDKFKTHELKTLLAEKNALSYAKLLNSLENPEVIDQGKNQSLLEQVFGGQRKRSARNSRNSSQIEPSGLEIIGDASKNIKIKIENDSSLFQKYAKIATKYIDEYRLPQV